MSSRPKRSRKAPERFGAFASPEAEELEELEEEAPQVKRGRRGAAADSESEGELEADQAQGDEEDSEGEEGSEEEEEEEEEERLAARRPAKRQRTAAASAAAAQPFVPAPPAQPRSRGDMLSLLFACPALIDSLLEADGLRTISLVARDAANLVAALGARGAEAAPLWRQLARRCQPELGAEAEEEQVRAAILRGIRGDIARKEVVNKSTAQGEFRLTQKELGALPYTTRPNPLFHDAPPVKMYNKLAVLAVAHRKHGSAAGLAAAKAVAGVKSAKASQTRKSNEEARRERMEAALASAGLPGIRSHSLSDQRPLIKAFVKHNKGTPASVVAAIRKHRQEEEEAEERRSKLTDGLRKEGLLEELWRPPAQAFIRGGGGQSLDEVVAALRADKETREGVGERQRSVDALFAAEEGLQGYKYRVTSQLRAFVERGEGSAEAVVAEARAHRDRLEGHAARRAAIYARLEAEGLQAQRYTPAVTAYVNSGEGSEEAAVAAARAAADEAAVAAQARDARRSRMTELLEAEGLQRYATGYHLYAVSAYISSGEGSEEAVVAAARAAAAAEEAAEARRAGFVARLQAEGIEQSTGMAAASRYIYNGEGSEDEAMAAVRKEAQKAQQRQQRRDSITAALAGEGQSYEQLQWRVTALRRYVENGAGSEAEALAAARRVWQPEVDRRERQELVDAALAAEDLQKFKGFPWEANSRDKYVIYGEGSVEGVVAAARKRQAEEGPMAEWRAKVQAEMEAEAEAMFEEEFDDEYYP